MAYQIAVKARRGSLSPFQITFAFALSLIAVVALGATAPAAAPPVQPHILLDARTGEVLQ
jgi:hypothetical protein